MNRVLKLLLGLSFVLLGIFATTTRAEAQYRYTFADSLGIYKVEFTPFTPDADLATRLNKPLAEDAREVRLGMGFISYLATGYYSEDTWLYGYGNENMGYGVDMPVWLTMGAEYGRWFREWLYLGGSFVWTGGFAKCYDYDNYQRVGTYSFNNFTLMPIVRFAWLRRGIVQLYSSLGVGVQYCAYDYFSSRDWMLNAAYDVTFFGVSVGRKWFGYMDIGAGNRGVFSVGLGYRFNNNE